MSKLTDEQCEALRLSQAKLRESRALPPARDLSINFVADFVEGELTRRSKQLGDLAELWQTWMPHPWNQKVKLEALARGTLQVAVASQAHKYELERLLRSGLERDLVHAHKGPALRRIKVRVDASLRDIIQAES